MMKKSINDKDWKQFLPIPVCEDVPEYEALYQRAWELAHDHIREIPGMPQTPYMDEAFCDTQIWIWDTCFMSLFCKFAGEIFPGVESLRNFYDVLYDGKTLPKIVPKADEPDWTGATPGVLSDMYIHIADNPPLFAWAEYENAKFHGDIAYIKDLLYGRKVLQMHYEWMESLTEQTTPHGVRVNTCLVKENCGYRWEGGRSGMDNTPRGRRTERTNRARPNNPDMLWIDAICQQALAARMIAELFGIVGDPASGAEWEKRFEEKKELVNALYWDEEDGFYYDIDRNTHDFYKVMTIASYWALTAGIATKERADEMVGQIENEKTLGGCVPLLSLSRADGNFESDGGYWRGALWLPTAYAALKGMASYGYYEQAHTAAKKVVDHMLKTYLDYEPHTIWECYSPTEPKPAKTHDGKNFVRRDFCGWSALGPISIYIEFVLGFHTADAFQRVLEWEKPKGFQKEIGIRNFRFGDIVTDVVAKGDFCTVISNKPYTLKINGHEFSVCEGEQTVCLSFNQ